MNDESKPATFAVTIITPIDQEFEKHWRAVVRSTCLQRAIWALGELNLASPVEIAKCINARTPFHWAGPGCAKFFRSHFVGKSGCGSLYFFKIPIKTLHANSRQRYRYSLTKLGRRLLARIKTK